MATNIATIAMEQGTFAITLSFTDETGAAVAPTTLTWTLTDTSGTVINSRQDVVVSSPASSVDIALYGDDLAFQSSETGQRVERRLAVEATYSSNLGTDLPMKAAFAFLIENITAVT